jgi:mRNA-degrading endonuclease RelE of RelBE toxin-antitoxin system
MALKVELSVQADRELGKLDPQHSRRIVKFLSERLAKSVNPAHLTCKSSGSLIELFRSLACGFPEGRA